MTLKSPEDVESFFARLREYQVTVRHPRSYWIAMRYTSPKEQEFWKFIAYERDLEDEDLRDLKESLLFRAKQGKLCVFEEQVGLSGFLEE